ncbi:MAG: hypothetical protein ACRD6W_18415, partial [Nitrososphaerales archaeon]
LVSLHLDDIENAAQRNFSSEPPGQSRQFEYPSNNVLLSVLNEYAFLSNPGSAASFPLTITLGVNDTLTAITVSGGPTATIVVPAGSYSAAALAVAINAQLVNAGLGKALVASVQPVTNSVNPGQIQIDTVAPGNLPPSFAATYAGVPQPPIGGPVSPPPFVSALNSGPTAFMHLGGTLATALSLSTSALSGLPVANGALGSTSLKGVAANAGVYIYTAIAGQTGAAATVVAVGSNGTATIGGLTGMTANSTLHYLVLSGGTSAANRGTWQIVQYISATSVVVALPGAVVDLAGTITWFEDTVTFNISYAHIGALSTFASMEGYNATTPTAPFLTLATAIQNAVSVQLIETGPVLLSFGKGKISIMLSSYFQPGYPNGPGPNSYPFGLNESAESRLGYAMGPAVWVTQDDGVTQYTI